MVHLRGCAVHVDVALISVRRFRSLTIQREKRTQWLILRRVLITIGTWGEMR